MEHTLSMYTWVSLTTEQRNRIRQIFSIPRSAHVVVNDGRIETDGTTPEDFKHLTVSKMQEYVKSDSTDFHKLFDRVLAKVQDEIEGKPEEIISIGPINVINRKNAKKSKQK